MRNHVADNDNSIKCAKSNDCAGESKEPDEAATLKYEVAPVQSNRGEEVGDGVDDDESDGGGAGGLAVGHVASIAEHCVVEHGVKADDGSRNRRESKNPGGKVV